MYVVKLKMKGVDRENLIADLVNIISKELHVNIRALNIKASDGIFKGTVDIYIKQISDTDVLIQKIKCIEGIRVVERDEE